MRKEAVLFEGLTLFFAFVTVLYIVMTHFMANGVEWAGATAMVMTTGLTLIIATYFRFVARRLDLRPEDYPDAEIADGAGELGFYSPHSWWPVLVALAAALTAVAIAFWLPWLIAAGAAFILASAAGLVFEYYTGPEKH